MGAVHLVNALDGLAMIARGAQLVRHADSLEHQDAVVQFHLADDLAGQTSLARIDMTRLQRASEGAEQSATRGGDHVVDRRGVRPGDRGIDAIVLGDGAVHTERHRFFFRGHVRKA